jgi:hypothetical protein
MRLLFRFLLLPGLLFCLAGPLKAAVTVQASIDPPEVNVGDEVTVAFTIKGGSVADIQLPPVAGLTMQGSSTSSQFVMNGFTVSQSISQSFSLVPMRAGDFTIPSFQIHADDGTTISTRPLKLHVLGTSAAPAVATAPPAPAPGNGPVVMPPATADGTAPAAPDNGETNRTISVPTDPDGRPARVFHLITPRTTDAYVGESIPLTIQFYIRADSNAQQNSLPTLIGSDFLMNNLSLRPRQDGVGIANEEYIRDTWITAISAPKAGDFPLEATRDTYWTQGSSSMNDPFGGLFGRSGQLMHREIGSNKLIIHVHPLPDQDRPANFSGAIGNFQVSGNAVPATVGVGEPVTVHFTVSGDGNFDYVRCPVLASDPAWKTYVPTAKVSYEDESHTQATKTFEEAVVPLKNGTLPLPAASFSYFDPNAKHYVTVPVPLPSVVVTGEITAPSASPPPVVGTSEGGSSPAFSGAASGFLPNQLTLGLLTPDLAPGYRHPGFWVVQATLVLLVLAGLALGTRRPGYDSGRAERELRYAAFKHEEDAMNRTAREGDAVGFFSAARHAVQLRLAERWQVAPDSLTLPEIERRDPALGESVAPLFNEADDVIYSGSGPTDLDLAEWDRRVRGLLESAQS